MGVWGRGGEKPPGLAEWIIARGVRKANRMAVLGDFEELYLDMTDEQGRRAARLWYRQQALATLPNLLKSKLYWSVTMIKNYMKTAIRALQRQKGHLILNLLGLAVAMTVCMLIIMYVQDEYVFDRFNKRFDDIYRVQASIAFNGVDGELAQLGTPVGPTLVRDYPEIEAFTRIRTLGSYVVQKGDIAFSESSVAYTDPSFFDIFSIPLVQGDRDKILQSPYTLVISRRMAQKYFGNEDPIGQALTLDNSDAYEVQGVYEDFPDNAHFSFDFLISFSTHEKDCNNIWLSFNHFTYVMLKPGIDAEALNVKLKTLSRRYCGPEFKLYMGTTFDEVMGQGNHIDFYIEPLGRIHLHSNVEAEIAPQGDIRYVWLLSTIALFILTVACFNFVNLSTARAGKRAREVALRKVVGSPRSQLVSQFLVESFVTVFLALVCAGLVAVSLLQPFNQLAAKSLEPSALMRPMVLMVNLFMLFAATLGAGLYPALMLSSFKPTAILKDKVHLRGSGRLLRNFLVIFQFTLSVILLVSTLVIHGQMTYVQNKKLGFDKEHVLLIQDAFVANNQIRPFMNRCLEQPDIQSATLTSFLPVTSARNSNSIFATGKLAGKAVPVDTWKVDAGYLETMGLRLLQGRNFRPDSPADSTAVLVNEAMVRKFGWEEPVGQVIKHYIANNPLTLGEFHVVGVVEDFHYENMKAPIAALALFNQPSSTYLALKLAPGQVRSQVAKVESMWHEVCPGQPFSYSFMDERFNSMYTSEENFGRMFSAATAIALIIGCLGLVGLAAFTAEQRTKEIGVRKVLGASSRSLIVMLIRPFTWAVLAANAIGLPLAWYFMDRWLQSFAYRVDLSPLTLIFTLLATLVTAWLTVGHQALRSSLVNPVKSLKYE